MYYIVQMTNISGVITCLAISISAFIGSNSNVINFHCLHTQTYNYYCSIITLSHQTENDAICEALASFTVTQTDRN